MKGFYMINRYFMALILVLILQLPTYAQQAPEDCEDGRYTLGIQHLFNISQSEELYGTNLDAAGDEIELMMTIFTPDDDVVENRPVVILAFGGSFVAGQRSDMFEICNLLAMQGVVAVSIDYRLYPMAKLGFPTIPGFYDAAIKAVGDLKGAVRHIRKLVDNGNPYNMDADRIMLGGLSAGAIAALHAAALSEDDELDPSLTALIDNNGGIEGNTGDAENLSYSSEVLGVINLSGALLDPTILKTSDNIAIISMHGTNDGTVPYGSGNALGLIPMHGSSVVHQRALAQGLDSRLHSVEGGDHTDIYTDAEYENDRIAYFTMLGEAFNDIFCEAGVKTINPYFYEVNVFPNPASSRISWESDYSADVMQVGVYNQMGQLLINTQITGENSLDISELNEGVYYLFVKPLHTSGNSGILQGKFIKTR